MVPRLCMRSYPCVLSVNLLCGGRGLDAGAKCLVSQPWGVFFGHESLPLPLEGASVLCCSSSLVRSSSHLEDLMCLPSLPRYYVPFPVRLLLPTFHCFVHVFVCCGPQTWSYRALFCLAGEQHELHLSCSVVGLTLSIRNSCLDLV